MARTREVEVKPRNDAYTGLLAISFLALVAACILMALDAKDMGDPPPKLAIDVPGLTAGKAGGVLQRPDVKIDAGGAPAPMPMPMVPMGENKQSRRTEPSLLPDLPTGDAVVPVKAEEPADPTAPPLPVKPFEPPM